MNIDWSKAPEGATHKDPDTDCFYKLVKDVWHLIYGDGESVVSASIYHGEIKPSDLIERTKKQEAWGGCKDSEPESGRNSPINRSNDSLALIVASKTFYRFGNLFWGGDISRKDLIGKMAGTLSSSDGYRYVKCGKSRNRVAVHRVVFLMHHGYIPDVIDHINGIRDDNRAENLRDALGQSNNCANQKKQHGRTSKYKGVCWDSSRGKWAAYAKKNGVRFHLGRFTSEDKAAMAYNKKAKELFGEFSNINIIQTAD